MGSAASTKLKCPMDYDKEKFNIILKLYDHLDSNGDQVIETNELKDIANLHITNRKTELSKSLINENQDYNYQIEQATIKYDRDKADLKTSYDKNIEKINNLHNRDKLSITKKIKDYGEMSEIKKSEMFMKVISDDGKHIDFWKFFEYMKDRTQDIKNIEFTN